METQDKAQPVTMKATRKLETVEDFQLGMRFLALSTRRMELIREHGTLDLDLKKLAAALGLPPNRPIIFDGKSAFMWEAGEKTNEAPSEGGDP